LPLLPISGGQRSTYPSDIGGCALVRIIDLDLEHIIHVHTVNYNVLWHLHSLTPSRSVILTAGVKALQLPMFHHFQNAKAIPFTASQLCIGEPDPLEFNDTSPGALTIVIAIGCLMLWSFY